MSPCAKRVMPFRVVLGVAVAGMLAVPMTRSALAAAPSDSEGSFVLLSMEQAAMFSGTQLPHGAPCNRTGTYTGCIGINNNCGYDDPATCNSSLGRVYSGASTDYCAGAVPPPLTGTCTYVDTVACYTWFECSWQLAGYCARVWDTGCDITWDNIVCTGAPSPTDPPPLPPPGGG
jgi:hypothetical protein